MYTSDQIILSDACRRLKEEITRLRLVVAALTSERDDLQYHICPELTARYAELIGNYENRLHYQEITIRELKRRIEMVQAAINYERRVSQEEVDRQVEKEYQKFWKQVDEENQQNEQAKWEQRQRKERESASRERWRERYGSGSGSAAKGDASNKNEKSAEGFLGTSDNECDADAIPDIKEMYRKIIRKLHPDGNPDITEREKDLFYKAVEAYKDNDIETMQEIYDEVFGSGAAEDASKELSYAELAELCEQLKMRIERLQMEIDSIKISFPYTEKKFLDDVDAVAEMQLALETKIQEYEDIIQQLNQTLQNLMQEMENLQR